MEKYDIGRILGKGGFATVHLARDRQRRNLQVAIKLTNISSDTNNNTGLSDGNNNVYPQSLAQKKMTVREMMKREINVLSSIRKHINIVQFVESFSYVPSSQTMIVGIVMEYCERGDLQSYFKRVQKKQKKIPSDPFLPVEEIRYAIKQILNGLSFLHSNGIVHRDIKASNILLSKKREKTLGSKSSNKSSIESSTSATNSSLSHQSHPSSSLRSQTSSNSQSKNHHSRSKSFTLLDCEIKIADFGLAVKMSKEENWDECQHTMCGTPNCLAPEVIFMGSGNNKEDDIKGHGQPVDLWSTGCILYAMMVGKYPFSSTKEPVGDLLPHPPADKPLSKHIKIQQTITRVLQGNWFLPPHMKNEFPECKDLLHQLLNQNPKLRGNACEILNNHPFFVWEKEENSGVLPSIAQEEEKVKDEHHTPHSHPQPRGAQSHQSELHPMLPPPPRNPSNTSRHYYNSSSFSAQSSTACTINSTITSSSTTVNKSVSSSSSNPIIQDIEYRQLQREKLYNKNSNRKVSSSIPSVNHYLNARPLSYSRQHQTTTLNKNPLLPETKSTKRITPVALRTHNHNTSFNQPCHNNKHQRPEYWSTRKHTRIKTNDYDDIHNLNPSQQNIAATNQSLTSRNKTSPISAPSNLEPIDSALHRLHPLKHFFGGNTVFILPNQKGIVYQQVFSPRKLVWMHLLVDGYRIFISEKKLLETDKIDEKLTTHNVQDNEDKTILHEAFVHAPLEIKHYYLGTATTVHQSVSTGMLPIKTSVERTTPWRLLYKPLSSTLALRPQYQQMYMQLKQIIHSILRFTPKITLYLYTAEAKQGHEKHNLTREQQDSSVLLAKVLFMEYPSPLPNVMIHFPMDGVRILYSLSTGKANITIPSKQKQDLKSEGDNSSKSFSFEINLEDDTHEIMKSENYKYIEMAQSATEECLCIERLNTVSTLHGYRDVLGENSDESDSFPITKHYLCAGGGGGEFVRRRQDWIEFHPDETNTKISDETVDESVRNHTTNTSMTNTTATTTTAATTSTSFENNTNTNNNNNNSNNDNMTFFRHLLLGDKNTRDNIGEDDQHEMSTLASLSEMYINDNHDGENEREHCNDYMMTQEQNNSTRINQKTNNNNSSFSGKENQPSEESLDLFNFFEQNFQEEESFNYRKCHIPNLGQAIRLRKCGTLYVQFLERSIPNEKKKIFMLNSMGTQLCCWFLFDGDINLMSRKPNEVHNINNQGSKKEEVRVILAKISIFLRRFASSGTGVID